MAQRDLAHSLFLRQRAIGTQRRAATQWWDEPISVWNVGVHDFPDRQRPLYGGRGQAGGTGFDTPAVLLGTPTQTPADLAVYMISYNMFAPSVQSSTNLYGFFASFAHIWTPQATPDPVAVAPPFFPALNRGFLRPRERVSDSGRGIILSGQPVGNAIQAQAIAAPRFAVETNIADIVITGPTSGGAANSPIPISTQLYFDPPLIVPGDQFVGVTALNPASTNGQGIVLDVQFVWREVSP